MRIYPDQIAINSHEPELTDQEIADGKTYWDAVWRAGNPPPSIDTVKAPWRGLASLYGAPRAAWIALQMTPTNLAAQPAAPTPDGSDPVPRPAIPTPPTRRQLVDEARNRRRAARCVDRGHGFRHGRPRRFAAARSRRISPSA